VGAPGGQGYDITKEKTQDKRGIEIVNQPFKGSLNINNTHSVQKQNRSGNPGPNTGNQDPSTSAKICKKKPSGPDPEPCDLNEGEVLFRTVELKDTCLPVGNGGTGISIQSKSCNKDFSNLPLRESVNPSSPIKDSLNLAKRDHGQHSIAGRSEDPNYHFIMKRGFMMIGGRKVPVCHPHNKNHLNEYQNSNFGRDLGELHIHDNSVERRGVNGNNNNKSSYKETLNATRPGERCDDLRFAVGNGHNTRTSPYLSDEKKGRMGSLMPKQSRVTSDLKFHNGLSLNTQNELSNQKIHDPKSHQPPTNQISIKPYHSPPPNTHKKQPIDNPYSNACQDTYQEDRIIERQVQEKIKQALIHPNFSGKNSAIAQGNNSQGSVDKGPPLAEGFLNTNFAAGNGGNGLLGVVGVN
jgi:hypothetical protein